MHLNDLAAKVKEGVRASGLVGYRFNTIGVSDGMSMGTSGMSYSLQSRDIIADSIETVSEGSLGPTDCLSCLSCAKKRRRPLIRCHRAAGRKKRKKLALASPSPKP